MKIFECDIFLTYSLIYPKMATNKYSNPMGKK